MRVLRIVALGLVIAAAFTGGYFYRAIRSAGAAPAGKPASKILYWIDPMHPAYKSDKPGIAPDCGMKLEPVYADGGGAAPGRERTTAPGEDLSAMPAGAIKITPEKQQLIGVKYGAVEKTAGS